MGNQNTAFFKRSKQIAEKFLRTSVIIDDRAFPSRQLPLAREMTTPQSLDDVPQPKPRGGARIIGTPQIPERGHSFDAQIVINAFAEKRMVCSVIQPTSESGLPELMSNLALSADIVILDWDLGEDDKKGTKVQEILVEVCKPAKDFQPQLRLLVIYTGEPDIADIAAQIRSTLVEKLECELKEDGEFTIICGTNRIAIFNKSDTVGAPRNDRKVEFEDLAECVISEFTEMTMGLVSNVAVEALSRIRENTSRILARFGEGLDAPYLTHRILQPTPSDAEDHIVSLISQELDAILLEDKSVGIQAGLEAITDWLHERNITSLKPAKNSTESKWNNVDYPLPEILELMAKGTEKLEEKLGKGLFQTGKTISRSTTAQFAAPKDGSSLDEEFAMLTSLRSFYGKSIRVLSLGTILKKISESETGTGYLLCMQPLCDTVRLKGRTAFPFLPLTPVTNGKNFDVVLHDSTSNQFLFFKFDLKPLSLKMIPFTPSPSSDRILALQNTNIYTFSDADNTMYEWVAELRAEQALRTVHAFATNIARVGLNESEWLRRSK